MVWGTCKCGPRQRSPLQTPEVRKTGGRTGRWFGEHANVAQGKGLLFELPKSGRLVASVAAVASMAAVASVAAVADGLTNM